MCCQSFVRRFERETGLFLATHPSSGDRKREALRLFCVNNGGRRLFGVPRTPMNFSSSELPTTILFFDHTSKMGGGEISLFNLVTHLDRTRFEPVVVLASDGALRQKLSDMGVETHVLPLSEAVTQVRKDSLTGPGAISGGQVWEIVRYVWQLRGFARRRGADILHTNSLKADIIGAIAGRLADLPVVWHVRDRIADDYLPSLATRVFRLMCRVMPSHVVVNSAATLEALQLPAHRRARVIYNGIVHDGLPFAELLDETGELPHVAHLNGYGEVAPAPDAPATPDAPIIGLVGRISPWKGQDIFLCAAAQVKERYPDARFQIIGAPLFGEENYELELRALCSELGLDESVEWLGFRTDVPQLIEKMTIVAHASKTGEPFGQVVVEAMMASRPLVATNGGGIPEIVVDGETGLLVPMNDAPAMASALLRLLDQPEWAKQLGQNGQRRAQANFTIAHTVAKINHLYADVLHDRRARARRRLWFIGGALALLVGVKALKTGLKARHANTPR